MWRLMLIDTSVRVQELYIHVTAVTKINLKKIEISNILTGIRFLKWGN